MAPHRTTFLWFALLILLAALALADFVSAHGRELDPRLGDLGVTLHEAPAQPGQGYWKIVRVEWQDEEQAAGRHHIDVDVIDEGGARILGAQARVAWAGGHADVLIEDKPWPELGGNFAMYAAGCSYTVEALGLPSDRLNCVGLGTPELRDWTIHVVYRITFQRATMGGGCTTCEPRLYLPLVGR
jgi:hypothetical protein